MLHRATFGCVPQMLRLKTRSVGTKYLGTRKVELVNGTVHRVVLDRGKHVEASLL